MAIDEENMKKRPLSSHYLSSGESDGDSNMSPSEKKFAKYEKQAQEKEALIRKLKERAAPRRN